MNILIETKYFISDLKNFLNPRYKFIRSKFSLTLSANALRIIIFKIPNFFFRFFNKTRIKNLINSNKEFYISKNHEYFTTNININEEDILNILDNLGECSDGGAVIGSKGGEERIYIDKRNSYAKELLLEKVKKLSYHYYSILYDVMIIWRYDGMTIWDGMMVSN